MANRASADAVSNHEPDLGRLSDLTDVALHLMRLRDRLDILKCHDAAGDVSMAVARISKAVCKDLDPITFDELPLN